MTVRDKIADLLDIQQLVNRYAVHIDLKEVDAWVELFEPDGVLDERPVGLDRLVGREAIGAYGRSLAADNLHAVHLMSNHVVSDVTGDTATGTAFAFVEAVTRSSGHARYYVRYEDRYGRRSGAWRFRERIVTLLLPPVTLTGP